MKFFLCKNIVIVWNDYKLQDLRNSRLPYQLLDPIKLVPYVIIFPSKKQFGCEKYFESRILAVKFLFIVR